MKDAGPRGRMSALGSILLGSILLGVAVAACGVPEDRGPTALSRSGVPFGLLTPSSSRQTTQTTMTSPTEVSVEIFLFGPSGTLVPEPRMLAGTQESLATVLGALVDGPTEAEAVAGLQSAIPPQTTVLGASIGPGGIATVNLAGSFGQLVGQGQIEAVAQIVFTATGLSGTNVTGVTFELASQPVQVPVANGAQVPIATRSQFPQFAPPPSTSGPSF